MQATDVVRRLRQHQQFARAGLVAAAQSLSEEQLCQRFAIGMGSVLDSLVHLYGADLAWLAALQGDPSVSPWEIRFQSLSALLETWGELDRRWDQWLAKLTDADLHRTVLKRSKMLPPGSPPLATTAADVLLHLATHSHYTVAQVTNMLRQLGVHPLPDTMLITMSRLQSSGAERR